MMRKGAKYLILPTRSGPSSQTAIELVEYLRRNGVVVAAPVCDVSSTDSLTTMLASCAETMPPIRGCINAAMTLQVCSNLVCQKSGA
jgi:NAD(P)-dependent dehydrogenase (short-subunit alcohol dehydrogenase family)